MVKAHVVHAWDDTEQVEALLQYCLVVLVAQFGAKASLRTAGKRVLDAICLAAAQALSHERSLPRGDRFHY